MEETFSWDIYEYLMDCDRRVSLSFMAINQSIRTAIIKEQGLHHQESINHGVGLGGGGLTWALILLSAYPIEGQDQ
jgi:hypothetical protein